MIYLICMVLGSLVTIACACMCAVGKGDNSRQYDSDNYYLLLSASGLYIAVIDKETGEIIEVYKNSGKELCDFKYESVNINERGN